MLKKKNITFLFGKGNWLESHVANIIQDLKKCTQVKIIYKHEDLPEADICFILGYPKIISPHYLAKHKKNYVIHASDLPKGRGMSPWVWDILEGQNTLHVCLIEAEQGLDEGDIIKKTKIKLNGHELVKETQHAIGATAWTMITDLLEMDSFPIGKKQAGEPSYHKRRYPKDSEININKPLEEQFNLLRIVDNEKYPAFFVKDGIKYILKITKDSL